VKNDMNDEEYRAWCLAHLSFEDVDDLYGEGEGGAPDHGLYKEWAAVNEVEDEEAYLELRRAWAEAQVEEHGLKRDGV
jgi:hypothetical protein